MLSLKNISAGKNRQCNYSDFQIFNGHCYFGNRHELTWARAQGFCHRENGYLADVQSSNENAAVKNVLPSSSNVAWIGLNDIQNKRQWVWSLYNYSVPSNYTNWIKGQPDNHGTLGEHCVEITLSKIYNANVGGWNDKSCNSTLVSVCKKGK